MFQQPFRAFHDATDLAQTTDEPPQLPVGVAHDDVAERAGEAFAHTERNGEPLRPVAQPQARLDANLFPQRRVGLLHRALNALLSIRRNQRLDDFRRGRVRIVHRVRKDVLLDVTHTCPQTLIWPGLAG